MPDTAPRYHAVDGSVLPLACTGVCIERAGRRLLDDVSISIGAGTITAILGPNGAGKSLLLRVLANLVTPDAGEVRWGAAGPGRRRAPRIGFVFQKPVLLRRSVRDNVAYALAATGVRRAARGARVDAVLALAALEHLAAMPARVLSGGEQQRVALARALVTAPEVLLLDEPTSSLDPASTLAIETLVTRASERGTRAVLVTHDLGQARRLADEVLFIHRGTLVERCEAGAFFAGPRSAAATAFIEGKILL